MKLFLLKQVIYIILVFKTNPSMTGVLKPNWPSEALLVTRSFHHAITTTGRPGTQTQIFACRYLSKQIRQDSNLECILEGERIICQLKATTTTPPYLPTPTPHTHLILLDLAALQLSISSTWATAGYSVYWTVVAYKGDRKALCQELQLCRQLTEILKFKSVHTGSFTFIVMCRRKWKQQLL